MLKREFIVVVPLCTMLTACLVYDNGTLILEDNYFKDRVNAATRDLVAKRYGVPLLKEPASDGGEAWLYEDRIYSGGFEKATTHLSTCRTHWLTFGADGILKKSETDEWCKSTSTR